MTMWMIRAGERGVAVRQFLTSGRIAIGGAQDSTDYMTLGRADLAAALARTHPGHPAATLSNWARQDIEFRDHMQVGDTVLTYNPGTRMYPLGQVLSEAWTDPDFPRDRRAWGLVREVAWRATVARDALPGSVHAALDRRTTLHRLPDETAGIILAAERPIR